MSKHTSVPWVVVKPGDRYVIQDADGFYVCDAAHCQPGDETGVHGLRRAADCVNTLAGWEDLSKVKALLDAVRVWHNSRVEDGWETAARAHFRVVDRLDALRDPPTTACQQDPKTPQTWT